tara:strand:- start:334 stop:1095 length:762 start_codon:yes stop_codon:yes gene_type:complete
MVNINTVYNTVLYILNKEQRGYVTPAEFNSLAVQVQEEIFESYFPDGNQLNRATQQNIQNDTEFFNMYQDNAYKLYPFEEEASFNFAGTPYNGWLVNSTKTLYRIGEILSTYDKTSGNVQSITDLLSKKEYTITEKSKLTQASEQFPIAYLTNYVNAPAFPDPLPMLKISPLPNSVMVNCLFKPSDPVWSFTIGTLGQYVYDPINSINFQLDTSEQTNLIVNILKYTGIIIRDPEIIQAATQESAKVQQNEKA